jgi:hypothetical protein
MAKVFLKAQDPKFCERTWQDVANLISWLLGKFYFLET